MAVAALAAVPFVFTACTGDVIDVVTVEVRAQVSVCVSGVSTCTLLPLPKAAAALLGDSDRTLTSGDTDDMGSVSFEVATYDTFARVIIRSSLINGGSAKSDRLSLTDPLTTVTIAGQLVPGIKHP